MAIGQLLCVWALLVQACASDSALTWHAGSSIEMDDASLLQLDVRSNSPASSSDIQKFQILAQMRAQDVMALWLLQNPYFLVGGALCIALVIVCMMACCIYVLYSANRRTDLSKPRKEHEVPMEVQPDPLSTAPDVKMSNPGMPLCSTLIIPDGHQLVCVVQSKLKPAKQWISFDVGGERSRGAPPLFTINVSEFRRDPGIMVETLDGKSQLAFLSTENLWDPCSSTESLSPFLNIYRPLSSAKPKGTLYGTIQKNSAGEYEILCGQSRLLTISGDFKGHNMHVTASTGRHIASTWQSSPEEYEVTVQSNVDAGLVILAILAVDKCS